jgi:hypothetical protein
MAKDKKNVNDKSHAENEIKKSRNVWKILAIVFVALFIVIMTLGVLRSHKFREPPLQLTQTQMDTVKSIALDDMAHNKNIIANYTIQTPGVAREIKTDSIKRNVTEVTIYNSTTRDMYIIDVNTGKILVYSETEFFDGLTNFNGERRMNENVPPGPPGERGFLHK